MIIVEEVLKTLFDRLPNIGATETTPDGFKPYYDWGNDFHLSKTYLLKKTDLYPLIYQTSNQSTTDARANELTHNLRLILAVQNTRTDEVNKTRWQGSTYNDILFPLMGDIVSLLIKTPAVLWDKEYNYTTFPNYGKDTVGKDVTTVDTWDAILFETTITIQGNVCL